MATREADSGRPNDAIGNPFTVPKAGELIADHIRRRIARGELKEGETLPAEQELMRQFDVSRPTLREAFRILEAESLVTSRRGTQARVQLPGTEVASRNIGLLLQLRNTSLADVYDARMVIEPPLCRALADHHTDADIRRLRGHLAFEQEHLEDLDVFALATADFHQILIDHADNQVLTLFVGLLEEIFQRHVTQSVERTRAQFDYLDLNRQALRNHTKLVDLIEAADGPGAEAHWRDHMEKVRSYVLRGFPKATVLDLYS
jgi:DNA-binding FadR family transcriptional regulator